MFADDTEYYCVGKTVDEVMSLLQTGIREISEWCKNNSLTIHPGKSEIMIISNKRFIGPPPPVRLGDNIIKVVSDSKCLGVSIDCKLTWKSQVSKAASSMNKKSSNSEGSALYNLTSLKRSISKVSYRAAPTEWLSGDLDHP